MNGEQIEFHLYINAGIFLNKTIGLSCKIKAMVAKPGA